MTARIDHAALAETRLFQAINEGQKELVPVAQVHATLALVEQQRIANLIALAHADTHEAAYIPALQALTDLHQPEGKGWTCTALNPDIAAALGVDQS